MPLSLIIQSSFTYCGMQSQHDPVTCRQGFECKGGFISVAEKYKRAETICKGQRLGNNSTNQCWIQSRCTEEDIRGDRSAFNTNIIQNREQVRQSEFRGLWPRQCCAGVVQGIMGVVCCNITKREWGFVWLFVYLLERDMGMKLDIKP